MKVSNRFRGRKMTMNSTLVDNAYTKGSEFAQYEKCKGSFKGTWKKGMFFLGCVERKSGCASMVRTAGALTPYTFIFTEWKTAREKRSFPKLNIWDEMFWRWVGEGRLEGDGVRGEPVAAGTYFGCCFLSGTHYHTHSCQCRVWPLQSKCTVAEFRKG